MDEVKRFIWLEETVLKIDSPEPAIVLKSLCISFVFIYFILFRFISSIRFQQIREEKKKRKKKNQIINKIIILFIINP